MLCTVLFSFELIPLDPSFNFWCIFDPFKEGILEKELLLFYLGSRTFPVHRQYSYLYWQRFWSLLVVLLFMWSKNFFFHLTESWALYVKKIVLNVIPICYLLELSSASIITSLITVPLVYSASSVFFACNRLSSVSSFVFVFSCRKTML